MSNRYWMAMLVGLGWAQGAWASPTCLMIPDWTADRIVSVSMADGHVLNANFIVDSSATGGHLRSPKNAIDSGRGTVLVSDQISDGVYEYTYSGVYVRTIADQSSHLLDNIRGIAMYAGRLYITVGAGVFAGTVQRMNLDGTGQTTWAVIQNRSGSGAGSPFDIAFLGSTALVSETNGSDIQRFDLNGGYQGLYVDSVLAEDIHFPQQIQADVAGTLIAGFEPPIGAFQYDGSGSFLSRVVLPSAPRGTFRLGNGEVLFTDGTGIYRKNLATGVVTQIIGNGNYQYIEVARPAVKRGP